MAQAVHIETKDEKPSEQHAAGVVGGQVFEIESAAAAHKVYPNAKIISNADGTPYEAPKSSKSDKDKE